MQIERQTGKDRQRRKRKRDRKIEKEKMGMKRYKIGKERKIKGDNGNKVINKERYTKKQKSGQ